jgi:SAM-dependent methyltransferase
MTYSLRGDRRIEWGWVEQHLPQGNGRALEIGPAPRKPKPSIVAVQRGWTVTAVGLEPPQFQHERFRFVLADFNDFETDECYDWILNISTIEHFGVAGRYGVEQADGTADLRGMEKARSLLAPGGRMLLTVPMGRDGVMGWHHRVYGRQRLPMLLQGWRTLTDRYYAKFGGLDEFQPCNLEQALAAEPALDPSYYALGLFVLVSDE